MRRLLIATMVLSFAAAMAGPADPAVVSADLYYYGWDVTTRVKLSPDDVRRDPRIVITVLDPARAAALHSWLALPEMVPVKPDRTGSARLVLDFTTGRGETITFYASRNELFSGDSSLVRAIDSEFRDRFRFGEEGSLGQ